MAWATRTKRTAAPVRKKVAAAAPRSTVRKRRKASTRTTVKKYNGCSVKSSYVRRSGDNAGEVVNRPAYSFWMKHRGQELITGVAVPHLSDFEVTSNAGNVSVKMCVTVTQGISKIVTTGFANPTTGTLHLPHLGVGYIASPTGGKGKGGYCFHPTGKRK